MKTIISIFVAILIGVATYSQTAPTTSLGTIEVSYPEQIINIPISVSEFSNIEAISLSLLYDKTALQFINYSNASDIYLQANDNLGVLRLGSRFVPTPANFSGGVIGVITMKWLGGKDVVLDWENNGSACQWSTPQSILSETPNSYENGRVKAYVMIGDMKWSLYNENIGVKSASQVNNNTIEKFCYAGKDENCATYGGMYQWAEAVQYYNGVTNTTHWSPIPQGYIQGVCPSGWHVPTVEEFEKMITILGGNAVAGGKIKETGTIHWGKRIFPSNVGATNSSGFTSLPSGTYLGGKYGYLNEYGHMWTVTKGQQPVAAYWYSATFAAANMMTGQSDKATAMAVRCVANSSSSTNIIPDNTPPDYGNLPVLIAPKFITNGEQIISVPVTVKNFNNIVSGTIAFDFNPNLLSVYNIVMNVQHSALSYSINPSSSTVTFTSTTPLSFADNTLLFTIQFNKKAIGVSTVSWETDICKWNGASPSNANYIDGTVNIK